MISKNVIYLNTFTKFIQIDLNINADEEILSKLFDFYSIDNNNNNEKYLEYIQFVDIFYPRYNLQLRRFLQQRNGLNSELKKINNITRVLLQKLFIRIINMIQNLIFTLNKHINIINYDINGLFNK